MTDREWAGIAAAWMANWPHAQAPQESLDKWRGDLSDLPASAVLLGVESIYHRCPDWPPNGAQVRREVLRLAYDEPEWFEVWRVLGDVAKLPRTRMGEGELVEGEPGSGIFDTWTGQVGYPRREALESQGPHLRAFVEDVGWEEVARCVRDTETAGEAQLREKYASFCRRVAHTEALASLPGGAGLRAIERARRGPRLVGDAVRGVLDTGPVNEE